MDIRAAQDSLRARAEALVNTPFRTREMREAGEKAKAEKYPTVSSSLFALYLLHHGVL